MKKIATKLIAISSQMLIVSLFLVLLFSGNNTNDKNIVALNNNFDKMADSVSFLFEEELMEEEKDDTVIEEIKDEKEIEKEKKQEEEKKKEEKVEPKTEEPKTETTSQNTNKNNVSSYVPVGEAIYGSLTGYGPDCSGCSGFTSSGYNVSANIYYPDSEYGNVRIIAADPSFPLYSIIRISNVPGMDPFIAVVLDRGGNVGYGKGTLFDLLFQTERDPNILPFTQNVKFEVIRSGK